jgi:hypothetical protein
VQVGTHRDGSIGIDGAVACLDVTDDTVLVNDNVGPQGPLVAFPLDVVLLENAILREHPAVHVAEEGKFDVDLLGEGGVCCRAIHAYTENFRIIGIDLARGESSLDRLELFGSTTSESQDINGEEYIFFAVKVAEPYGFPLIAEKSEIGSSVANFERQFRDFLLFLRVRGERRQRRHDRKEKTDGEDTLHGFLLNVRIDTGQGG